MEPDQLVPFKTVMIFLVQHVFYLAIVIVKRRLESLPYPCSYERVYISTLFFKQKNDVP